MDGYRNKNRFAPYDPRGPPPRPYQQQYDYYRNEQQPRRGGGGGPMRGRGSHRGGYGGGYPPPRRNDYENRGMYNMPYQSPPPPMPPQSQQYMMQQSQWNPPRNENWQNDYDHGYDEPSHSPDRSRFQSNKPKSPRDRPSRTLFIRNVEYDMNGRDLKEIFGKFGEIKGDVYDLIERRGMAFITYFDLRDAEQAKSQMHNAMLGHRKVEVHYALPKDEEENSRCDKTKNQGTLLLTLQDSDYTLDDRELEKQFGQYGEIKVIRVPFFKRHTENAQRRQRFIEYWDSRACVQAYDDTHGQEYKGGRWDVTFFWDHTPKERHEAHAKKEKGMGDPRRDQDNYHSDSQDRMVRDDYRGGGRDNYRDSEYDDGNSSTQDSYYDYSQRDNTASDKSHAPYDPERPMTSFDDTRDQLDKAQKAQQVLSMLTQAQSMQNAQPPINLGAQTPYTQYNATNQQHVPLMGSSSVPASTPPQQPENQMQQLLGLLSQVAQQQHGASAQQPLPISPQQAPQQTAPAVDPASALAQLAQLLQKSQQPPAEEQSGPTQTTDSSSNDY